MAQYIGGRIVPVHGGVWDNSKAYETLTIVLYKPDGDSYISRRAVPAGTAVTDTSYWMLYSLYSQQIADAVTQMENTDAALREKLSDAETRMNASKRELNERMDGLDARLDANVAASTDTDADYAAEVVDAREGLDGERFTSLGAAMRSFSVPYTFRERVAVTGNNVPLSGKEDYTEAGTEYIRDSSGDVRAVAYTATILKDYDVSSIMARTLVTAAVFKGKFLGEKMVIQLFSPVSGYMNFSIGHGSSGGEGDLGDHDGSPLQSDGTLYLDSISYNLYVGKGYNEILLNLDISLPQVQALSALMEEEGWTHVYVSLIPFRWKMVTFVPETGKTYRFCLAICTEGGSVDPDEFFASPSVATAVSALDAVEATYSQSAANAKEAAHAKEAENSFCSVNAGISVLGGGYSVHSTHEDLVVSMDKKCKVSVTATNATYLTTGEGFSIRIGTVAELAGKGILVYREETEGFEFKNIAINFGAKYGNYSYVTLSSAISEAGAGACLDFDAYAEAAKEKGISFTDETYCWLMFFGNSTWPTAALADGESITNTYRAFLQQPDAVIYDQTLEGRIAELEGQLSALQEGTAGYDPSLGNMLYGKKWFATGDSFTSGGSVEDDKCFTDGPYAGKIKTYPLFIGIRNNMDVTNDAISGSVMALTKEYLEDPDNVDINYKRPFSYQRYLTIPEDVDYITLWFGINDNGHTNLGTIDDTTNETFYGAWNVVMEWILTNRPWAHVGIIITNGSSAAYREAEREIARKWGIPYLDMMGDDQVPVMTLGRESSLGLCTDAYNLRRSTFSVGHTASGDSHPCWQAHEYESSFIEAFLRRL